VGKILMAALSRVDSFGKPLPDFYLYIDEFQNITTDSISSILSEARKYGLSLTIAHQFISQLDESIKNSVFGNVGSMAVFRVGAEDAKFLESQFAPTFTASDFIKIENHNAYLKMLINGRPATPFNIETLPPPHGNPEIVEQIKNLSYLRFGKDRKTVDDAILRKYLPPQAVPPQQSVSTPQPLPPPPAAPPLQMSPPQQPVSIPVVSVAPQSVTPAPSQFPAPAEPPVTAAQPSQFAQAFAQAAQMQVPIAPQILTQPPPSFAPPVQNSIPPTQ
jgi:hypothetical protein